MRKINENKKFGAIITTTNSQIDSADAQVTAVTSQTSTQSQPQGTIQSQSQYPKFIKIGRKKGSKNKAKTSTADVVNNIQQISSQNSQTVRRSTRLQAKTLKSLSS